MEAQATSNQMLLIYPRVGIVVVGLPDFILMEDNTSIILLEDNSSFLQMEQP